MSVLHRFAREFGLVTVLGAAIGLGGVLLLESVSAAPPNEIKTAAPSLPTARVTSERTWNDHEQFQSDVADRASSNPEAFPDCTAARAAGAAPVYANDPRYGPHLDGDDDGIGCEPRRRRR
ncbi:excalibur calcium-binding domain-containing protein [Terricaulis sp.]|uniref:excalibur calcium-binding domain-containing protein n=1 Tax=Terricaulis sp. TaxID=2768686 RepID=UPI002AC5FF1D|nr:excalibur calcium-binding domain-containing protein [Terricaulis sp.]MDZ4692740.1 excalibur calcium-binding domain-containing protein [Terricaulis sp.]